MSKEFISYLRKRKIPIENIYDIDITIEWLSCITGEFPDKKWDFSYLTKHPNFTIDWLREFPDKNWDFSHYGLSVHPNFTIEWVSCITGEFPDKKWNFSEDGLSGRPNFTIDWVREFPNKEWNFKYLSEHPNFTIEWVSCITGEFPDKKWNFSEDVLSH